jgi:acyl-CoA reductase-like NAD-dependent aldehyde dehydrogenase
LIGSDGIEGNASTGRLRNISMAFRRRREELPVKELTHFIGGKHVRGTSGRFGDGFEPMTGDVLSRVPFASKEEVRAAVENAIAAQPAWAATNPQRRARVLMKFLELIAREMDPLAELLAANTAKRSPTPRATGGVARTVG